MALTQNLGINVLSYFDINKVLDLCKVSTICQNPYSWRQFLNKKYNLNIFNNLTYTSLVAKANMLLKLMLDTNIVLTLRTFEYILLNMSIEDLDTAFSAIGTDIYSLEDIVYASNLKNTYSPQAFNQDIQFDYQPGENITMSGKDWLFSAQLTDIGKNNYTMILKRVMVPTTYISGNGQVKIIDFNADTARWAATTCPDDVFSDRLYLQLSNLQYDFYLRYFT